MRTYVKEWDQNEGIHGLVHKNQLNYTKLQALVNRNISIPHSFPESKYCFDNKEINMQNTEVSRKHACTLCTYVFHGAHPCWSSCNPSTAYYTPLSSQRQTSQH